MVRPLRQISLFLAMAVVSCTTDAAEDVDGTKDRFVERPFSWLLGSSLVEPATAGPIRVKVTHGATTKPWEEWTKTAVLKWLAPLRALPGGEGLTRDVVIVDRDEHLVVEVRAGGGRAHYMPGHPFSQQKVVLFEDANDLRVVVHEMGHAFGLGDTYVEGVWTCAADQPESVMCNGWMEDLRADDIRGVAHQYCKRTGRCDADAFSDSYGGGGGQRFRATCAEGQRLVGLDVRHDAVVDSFAPICQGAGGSQAVLPRVGGDGGGGSTVLACKAGTYVTGVRIRAGALVDAVRLACSDGTTTGRAGGDGGTERLYACPAPFPAVVGLRGASGRQVDRLGVSCDVALGPRFTSVVSNGDLPL